MTFGASSKVFSAFITDSLNRTNAFDLNSDAFKNALFNDTTTPAPAAASASTGYNTGVWVTGNEVTSAGQWAAAGVALASITSTFSTNVYTFDAADTASGSTATLSNAYGSLIYDDTLTTPVAKQGVCYLSFGGANSVTSGTFTVVYNASGIFTITL